MAGGNMRDINQVVLVGRLTRDVEMRDAHGTAIAEMSIAVNYSRKTGDEWKDEVSFIDAVLIGKRAEGLGQYLVKGKQVCIAGELRQERWEKDGQKRSKVKVVVGDIQLLGGEKRVESPGHLGYADNGEEIPF